MSFKELDQSTDVSTQISAVNEVIPLTGTFFSGTDVNTKFYINVVSGSAVSGGFWQTIYDGAPTSTSASALVDITYGHSSGSTLAAFSETYLNDEKERIYRQMAQLLLGDEDAFFQINSATAHEMMFFLLKRRIFKDEIKKGNTTVTLMMPSMSFDPIILSDAGAASSYTAGVAGDEASFYSGSTEVGKVYYNAGIIAISTASFITGSLPAHWSGSAAVGKSWDQVAISGNLDNILDGLRLHIMDDGINFQNQTNLHSTIYFCRALNADFNYSSNPTFIDSDGRIIATSGTDNQTRTYPTTIGLYDINDNLLAVCKTSEPIKKSPDNEIIFRCRLSY
jgi:hypothetical protein